MKVKAILGIIACGLLVLSGLITFATMRVVSQEGHINRGAPTPSPDQKVADFRIIRASCQKDLNCLVFAEANENLFVCDKMRLLAQQLRREFASYKHVRVLLFDEAKIADEYVKGLRSPRDVDKDIRGVYEIEPAKSVHFIEFASEKGGKFNEIRINLQEP